VRKSLDFLHGNLSLLRRSPLDAEQRAALQGVEQSTSEVLLALEQLRDVALGSADAPAQSFPFDLERTLSWVYRQFRGAMKSNGLDFELKVAPDTPFGLVGDARRLRSVLVCLLDNALQFTAAGSVTLKVGPTTTLENNQVSLRFEVIDTGSGLPCDVHQSILSGDLCSEKAPGLSIVQRWLETVGTRLRVEESAQGSNLWFEVTFGLDRTPEALHARSGLAGKRMLIVAPGPANRRLLEKSLQHVGAFSVSLPDLESTLAFLESGELPDAIILDSELPGCSQETAAEALLKSAEAPLVLLVPLAARGDGHRFRELGCRAYLVKPLQQEQVLEALSAALAEGSPPHLITTHSLEEATKLKTRVLLLVEESMLSRQAEHLFRSAGHEVARESASCETIRELSTDFDLVLIEQSRCTPALIAELDKWQSSLPRIGLVSPEDSQSSRVVNLGVDEVLYTPLRAWEVSQIIHRWAGRELQREPTPPAVEEAPPVNMEVLNESTDGDVELQKEMIEAFFDDLESSFSSIEKAFQSGRLQAVASEAHTLKGSAPYFGADVFTELAEDLEAASKRGDMKETREAHEACYAEYQKIVDFFASFNAAG